MESNDIPELPGKGETSDIPGLPSGDPEENPDLCSLRLIFSWYTKILKSGCKRFSFTEDVWWLIEFWYLKPSQLWRVTQRQSISCQLTHNYLVHRSRLYTANSKHHHINRVIIIRQYCASTFHSSTLMKAVSCKLVKCVQECFCLKSKRSKQNSSNQMRKSDSLSRHMTHYG